MHFCPENVFLRISIHALREEGDPPVLPVWMTVLLISIHALREEGDHSVSRFFAVNRVFLSTPSARRATCTRPEHRAHQDISIHALREEGDRAVFLRLSTEMIISIHALREEGDDDVAGVGHILVRFLSTPSARRATLFGMLSPALSRNFYPRPPRGGRRSAAKGDASP